MSKLYKLSLLVLLMIVITSSSILPYKKVKVFIPETPEIDLVGVNKIAVLDFESSQFSGKEVGNLSPIK